MLPIITIPAANLSTVAGSAFDGMADDYDRMFTNSLIGRAQRKRVWDILGRTFDSGDKVLEINCGTGEDALFLSRRGVEIVACDASERMIETARKRLDAERQKSSVTFLQLPTEYIGTLQSQAPFDGVFSNFSGLNCVEDLKETAVTLGRLLKPGASALFCLSTRFCLTEILFYSARGQWQKAIRRCGGATSARIEGKQFPVYYPTLRQLRDRFAPYFKISNCVGIGVAVPPSYLEKWARKHQRAFRLLCGLERILSSLPICRVLGDHMLIELKRTSHVAD